MGGFLQRCRGALGIAITWGGVWGAIFAAVGLIIGLVDPGSIGPGEGPLVIVGTGAVLGFVSGAVFGVLLSLAEGGKRIVDLSLGRAALWGALATAVYPLLTPADNRMLLFLCPIGAALAAASVAVAKKAALGAAQASTGAEGMLSAEGGAQVRKRLQPPTPRGRPKTDT